MASFTGTAQGFDVTSDASPGSLSLTIPSDAEAVIVFVGGYSGGNGNPLADELCFDAGSTLDFTHIASGSYSNGAEQISVYIMTDDSVDWPGTGAQTLSYSAYNSAYDEGHSYIVAYVKDIDSASPVTDSDVKDTTDSAPWTSTMTGASTGDLCVIGVERYNAAVTATSGEGQTVLLNRSVFNLAALLVEYEDGENSMKTSSDSDLAAVAFILKDGGGGSSSAPLYSNHVHRLNNG